MHNAVSVADVADRKTGRRNEPVNAVVGELLRHIRDEREMTQAEVATKAGTSRASVANIERGDQGVSVALLLRLAAAVGTDPAELIARTRETLDHQQPNLDRAEETLRESLDERELGWVLASISDSK
jgi:transcriptional regulator with XRE-family HTH domain